MANTVICKDCEVRLRPYQGCPRCREPYQKVAIRVGEDMNELVSEADSNAARD